jgi:hypothetical protein
VAEASAQEVNLDVLSDDEIDILFGNDAHADRNGLEEWLNEGGKSDEG